MLTRLRKRYVWYAILIVAAVVLFLFWESSESPVTSFNLGRIKPGMGAPEVELILGPGSDEATFRDRAGVLQLFKDCSRVRFWRGGISPSASATTPTTAC
jgi:hypothetical protein